jgi:hypothetical protein
MIIGADGLATSGERPVRRYSRESGKTFDGNNRQSPRLLFPFPLWGKFLARTSV